MSRNQEIWDKLVMKSQYDTKGMFIDEKQKSAIVSMDHWVRLGQRAAQQNMNIYIVENDDGFWLMLDGKMRAGIHLDTQGEIVTAALEEAAQ